MWSEGGIIQGEYLNYFNSILTTDMGKLRSNYLVADS